MYAPSGRGHVPHPDRRGAGHESLSRRDARRARSCRRAFCRVHAVLPARGGSRGQGHARASARPRVRQGRARALRHAREFAERARAADAPRRRRCSSGSGSRIASMLLAAGDTGFASAKTYDLEAWAPGVGEVARGVVVQHVHRLPGAAREHPLSARAGREAALRAHAQRLGARVSAHHRVRSSSTTSSRTAASSVPEVLRPYVGADAHRAEPCAARAPVVVVAVGVVAAARLVRRLHAARRSRAAARGVARSGGCTRASIAALERSRAPTRPRRRCSISSRHIRESGVPLDPHRRRRRPDGARPTCRSTRRARRRRAADARVRRASSIARIRRSSEPRRRDGALSATRRSCAGCGSFRSLQAATLALLLLAGVVRVAHARRAPIASRSGRAWRASRRTSSERRSRALSGWIELLREREGDPMTDAARSSTWTATSSGSSASRIGSSASGARRDESRWTSASSSSGSRRISARACRRSLMRVHDRRRRARRRAARDSRRRGAARVGARSRLIKNAIDALAGRGGRVDIVSVARFPKAVSRSRRRRRARACRASCAPDLRAGFSTKERGWGIGLALARRIVEENHGGQLLLVPTERGATFDDYLALMTMTSMLRPRLLTRRVSIRRSAKRCCTSRARCSCSPAPARARRACSPRASRA